MSQSSGYSKDILESLFSEIFREHEQRLYTLAFRLTKSDQYAKDIIQEVFLKLWEHRENLHTINNMEAWLYRLTENKTIDFLRKVASDSRLKETIWNKIFEVGAPQGLKPIGLAARDTLRLEMGYCLYGNDIDDTTSPLEAGLGWITKFTKNFTAKDVLQKQKEEGVKRKLVGFEMVDRGIPRHHYDICDAEGKPIGYVTSGTQSPSLNKAIGMGYVEIGSSDFDSAIYIKVRDKLLQAKVVKIPFN